MNRLGQHIEHLLLEHDCVILPEFGGFVAHHESARWDDDASSFLPPTRSVGFNASLKTNDGTLAQSYMDMHFTHYADAERRAERDVNALREELHTQGQVNIAGIGQLTDAPNGGIVFQPATSVLPTPSMYGLDAFEMLTLRALEHQDKQKQALGKKAHTTYTLHIPKAILHYAAAAVVVLVLLFSFSVPVSNTDVDTNQYAGLAFTHWLEDLQNKSLLTHAITAAPAKEEVAETAAPVQTPTEEAQAPAVPVIEPPTTIPVTSVTTNYHIIVASVIYRTDAELIAKKMEREGFHAPLIIESQGRVRVAIASYADRDEALKELALIRKNPLHSQAWVLVKKLSPTP